MTILIFKILNKVGITQLVEYQIVALKVIGSNPVIYPFMYHLLINWYNLNTKVNKITNKNILNTIHFKNFNKNSIYLTNICNKVNFNYVNLKIFDTKKLFKNYIFINKTLIKNLCFLIFNQNTFNLKINMFNKHNNFFFSIGIILVQLKLFKKNLRKSLKSYRLLFSYLSKKINRKKINLIYVLLKNSKKNSFVTNYIFKLLNFSNIIFFYKPNNFINTNIKTKKSIKKKIKKKLIIRNNSIV